jgi:UPF0755 protein
VVQTPAADVDERSEGRNRRPPHWGLRLGIAFLIVAGLVVAAGVRYYAWCRDASGPQRPVTFTVVEGASGNQVVDALHERGVVRCGEVSKWLLRRSGKADAIRAGTYTLTTNMTPDAAFTALSKAPPPAPTVDLTIPEGFRLTQIAARVQQVLHIGAQRFLHAADAGTWSLPPYLPKGTPLEGFLFPNTYEFLERGTTPDDVIAKLLDEFGTEAASLPWDRAEALGVTPYQVVTIASMIEEEARIEKDRPLISAVIYNRLARGMPLGIDATVAYIDPDPSNGLTASDFQIRSPYNTRLHAGLPPTPIASPGRASLEAALNPAHVPYLYYVLCGADGHHEFSVTYQRFLQDKARCLG